MAIDIMRCYSTEPKPRDYVLPGLIPGTVGSIVSPGGAGKSMLALMLAHEVAGGVDALDLPECATGPAVYLSAEDGGDILHERLFSIGQHLSPEFREACASNLLIEDLTTEAPDLMRDEWLKRLEAYATNSRLLFIDTLRSFHTGDENDGGAMSALVGHLRAIAASTRCAIVFLHHSSKALAIAGQGDMQQASRGSSVLTDNIRWQSYLATMTKDEAERLTDREFSNAEAIGEDNRGLFVRFGISKQNYGAPLNEKWFKRCEGGILQPVHLRSVSKAKGGGRDVV